MMIPYSVETARKRKFDHEAMPVPFLECFALYIQDLRRVDP